MKKISSTIGYPLTQSSPAAIEKYLVDRVRDDLGDFHDMALITPILKIDSQDGDLSGNVTNAYGTIVVKVINKAFTIPFIIHNKELLPFDTIRMGDDQVSYDMSKLRQLVVQLDKVQRESESDDSMESIVSIKEVPTQNGFLGTIMSVRDNAALMDSTNSGLYTGDNFGLMDTERTQKLADVSELFEQFHEKLAEVHIFTEDFVKESAEKIEDHFTKIANEQLENYTEPLTKTAEYVRRQIEMLQADKLVDASVAYSGNNISFPVRNGTMFEKRLGRVYKAIQAIGKSVKSDVKRIVIDSHGQYSLLTSNDKFMVLDQDPPHFEMKTAIAASLEQGRLYTVEKSQESIYSPFLLKHRYVEDLEGMFLVSSPELLNGIQNLDLSSSRLFRDFYVAEQVLPTQEMGRKTIHSHVIFAVFKDSNEPLKASSFKEIEQAIAENEVTAEGLQASRYALDRMIVHYLSCDNADDLIIYTVGENYNAFFPLTSKMEGYFTKPNGYFEEGFAFEKSAGYNDINRVRLVVENQNPPIYTLEWKFLDNSEEDEYEYHNIQSRRKSGLSPDQAKKLLTELGYDEQTKERFFQISKQNGRMAEFRLPSVELAAQVVPEDKGRNKAAEFVKNLVDTSLNANNFLPQIKDTVVDNFSDAAAIPLDAALSTPKGSTIRDAIANVFKKDAAASLETAVAFEKLAEQFRGNAWLTAAQLFHVKHHLDKLAYETTNNFVKESEQVWALVPEFETALEKTAKELILCNREQHLKLASHVIPEEIIKDGLRQLDGFTRYANLSKQLGKLNFFASHHHS